MSRDNFSPRLLKGFITAARQSTNTDALAALFKQNKLPETWLDPGTINHLDAQSAAQAYATIQGALRVYFGRGARGTLLRIGRQLWEIALKDAPMGIKAQAGVTRGLPENLRRKATLELLAKLLGSKNELTVHTLDMDLLLVDHLSPSATGQTSDEPICYVTLGLIQGALYWATGKEIDVEETSCCASGNSTCEFRIKSGG